MMKATVKNILGKFDLLDQARRLLNPARRMWRRIKQPFKPSDRTILAGYFAQNSVPKLHIGCANHVIDGWLNTDYDTKLPADMHLDVKQRFPFQNETFNYIFTEHVIEHLSYGDGVKMLSELFRVLKKPAS